MTPLHEEDQQQAGDARVAVINPLPLTLHHYELELLDVLSGCRLASVAAGPTVSAEMTDGDASSRLGRAAKIVCSRLAGGDGADVRLVLWPVFGLMDAMTWLRQRNGTWLVVHDPEPLRRQVGMGPISAWAGGLASRHGVGVIVHSVPASDVLRGKGWRTTTLPHPIRRPADRGGALEGLRLTVLGQWKPARSIVPLRALAAATEWHGRRDVVGRGWPEVDGWSVESRFVTEAELSARIDSSACVVLPYDRYFQSGIAVRCLEQLTPVVGQRHPFLQDLFGNDWPGLVDDDDWPAAVARVREVSPQELDNRRQVYWARCTNAWKSFLRQHAMPGNSRH
jgi:hypothetical protein